MTETAACADRPLSADAYLALIRDLAPAVSAGAAEGDRLRALPQDTVDALRRHGLFKLSVPRHWGGAEMPFPDTLAVIEALARIDGSTGWVVQAVNLELAAAGAYLQRDAAATIFADPDVIIGGQGVPRGFADRRDGGYWVAGEFSYASGVKHASWLHTGALIRGVDGKPVLDREGRPTARIFNLPVSAAILGDNWHVLGLRGTGSIDYAVRGSFVPDEFSHDFDVSDPVTGGALYRGGIVCFASTGHTGFALGVARRALDEAAEIGRSKTGLHGRVGDMPDFQIEYGRMEAALRGARLLAYDSLGAVQRTLDLGNKPSTREITLMRLALCHATDVASDVTVWAYRAGGGVSLRDGALQRCFRDMHAGTQHFLVSRPFTQACGRELAGLAPGAEWKIHGLVGGETPEKRR